MSEHETSPVLLEERKRLTFEEAEGVKPLPSQLKRGEISPQFRAVLWSKMRKWLKRDRDHFDKFFLDEPWATILTDALVQRDHQLNDFPTDYDAAVQTVKNRIENGSWWDVLGWLEWVFNHPRCPSGFPNAIDGLLTYCRLGYRVFDNTVICFVGSEAERDAISKAFADLARTELNGARIHLRKAAEELTAGNYAGSVRESVHAVESVVSVLEPRGDFAKALAKLDNKVGIHGAMKAGFASLYGFSSNENGIRHPLLQESVANVDETDALFMLGACAAFVSYLINKSRAAGLLGQTTAETPLGPAGG
jgi:hypothetical protein